MHDAHRQRNRLAGYVFREAFAVPALERAGERGPDAGSEVEPDHEHVAHFAAGGEVVDGPLVCVLFNHLGDRRALGLGTPGGGVLEHVAHDLVGVSGVVHERLRPDRDLVAKQGRDLVRMPGAADVAQERDPVGVRPHLVAELRFLGQPAREEAGAQLRLERLTERVVLCERQRGDELGETERRREDRAYSRCIGAGDRGALSHTTRLPFERSLDRERASEKEGP